MNANVKNDYNKVLKPKNGMAMLFMLILGELAAIACFIGGIVMLESGFLFPLSLILVILCAILAFIVLPILFGGLRTLRPNEAYVLTLFGEYYGTLYGPGFYFINPFASPINPASEKALEKDASELRMDRICTGTGKPLPLKNSGRIRLPMGIPMSLVSSSRISSLIIFRMSVFSRFTSLILVFSAVIRPFRSFSK